MRSRRVVLAAAAIVVVAVIVTACAGGGRIGQILRPGLESADDVFRGYVDDIATLSRQDEIVVPARLDDAVRQVEDEIAAGARMTDEEAALLARSDAWVRAYRELNDLVAAATGWEAAIPDDAIRLVSARIHPDSTPAFRAYVEAMTERALKAAMCDSARQGLDAAGEAQAGDSEPGYDDVGADSDTIAAFLLAGLRENWPDGEYYLDVAGLSVDAILTSNEHVAALVDIAESPNGAIAGANVVYFRSCVLR